MWYEEETKGERARKLDTLSLAFLRTEESVATTLTLPYGKRCLS